MSDRDTATVDVSKGEARVLIAALADFERDPDSENADVAADLRSRLTGAFD